MKEYIFSNVLHELINNKFARNYVIKKLDNHPRSC